MCGEVRDSDRATPTTSWESGGTAIREGLGGVSAVRIQEGEQEGNWQEPVWVREKEVIHVH